jgi:hypothetical protein
MPPAGGGEAGSRRPAGFGAAQSSALRGPPAGLPADCAARTRPIVRLNLFAPPRIIPEGICNAPEAVSVSPTPQDIDALKLRIAELQLEHRGLDQVIERLVGSPDSDELTVRRLKKRKLQIKDAIVLLQMQLTPDVPA